MGLPYGALVYLAWRLNNSLMSGVAAFVAMVIGVTAVATISEIGTTFNDIPVAVLILGALLLLVRNKYLALAGALLGIAASVKLYALYYAVAATIALLVARRRFQPVLPLSLGGVGAFAIGYGPWAVHLWRVTGDPLFPYWNAVFRSPLFPPRNWSPDKTALDWLDVVAPLKWARENVSLVTELTFRDARMLLAYLAVIVLATFAIFDRRSNQSREQTFVLIFASVGYVAWFFGFRLLRFAIPLEVLTGTLMMLFLIRLVPSRTMATVAGSAMAALLIYTAIYINWGRSAYADKVFPLKPRALPPNSMVIVAGQPLAYILPFLDAPGMSAVGLTWLNVLSDFVSAEFKRRLLEHTGPIFAIAGIDRQQNPYPNKGIKLSLTECEKIAGALDPETVICRATVEAD